MLLSETTGRKTKWCLKDIASHTQIGTPRRIKEKNMILEMPKDDEEMRKLQQQLDECHVIAQAEAEERQRQVEQSSTNIAQLQNQIAQLNNRAEEQQAQLTQSHSRVGALMTQLARSDTTKEELQRQLAQSHRRAEVSDRRAQELERRTAQLQLQLTQSEARVQELDTQKTQSDRTAEELARRVSQLERSLRERGRGTKGNDTQWVVTQNEIDLTGPEIGRGAWAAVIVAKFRGAQVAVKRIHNVIISRHNAQLFHREMTMASRLRHPNLVQFIGATIEGEMLIVMEFMTTSLRRQLQIEEYFQPKLVKSISLDVAKALSYLHLVQPDPIVHRDISSANVLLEQQVPPKLWKAKVSDYGTVNLIRQLNTTSPGCPAYAAPEANIPSLQTSKMDIFSLGALVLEMITGQLPAPEDREELLSQVHHDQLLSLIRRCLSENTAERPTAGDIISQLN